MSQTPFNPLDIPNLGQSIANAMLVSDPTPMADLARFPGAGVYAIYYKGAHPAYQQLVKSNEDQPIQTPVYVGKAIPAGGRQGINVASISSTTALSGRLLEHQKSIQAAENLDVTDFSCRWLVVESIWIPLGESLMISKFSPIWNTLVDGFGNHAPGAGRQQGKVSRWDVLHPGRSWASALQPRSEDAAQVGQDVEGYFRDRLQVPGADALGAVRPPVEPFRMEPILLDDLLSEDS